MSPAKKRAASAKKAAAAPAKKAGAASAKRAAGRPRSAMSDSHKKALAEGRQHGRAVRLYLQALETHKPKRGRKRTPDSVARRLHKIEAELATADAIKRLTLVQEELDLRQELASLASSDDLASLEAEFVAHAKSYGESKGISYTAWRSVGVPAEVLRAAGISRGGA